MSAVETGTPLPSVEPPPVRLERVNRPPPKDVILFTEPASSDNARVLRRTGSRMLKDSLDEHEQPDPKRIDAASRVIGLSLFVDGDPGDIPAGIYIQTRVQPVDQSPTQAAVDQALHEYQITEVRAGKTTLVVGDEVIKDEKTGQITKVKQGVILPLAGLRQEAIVNVQTMLADPTALAEGQISDAERAYINALVSPVAKTEEVLSPPAVSLDTSADGSGDVADASAKVTTGPDTHTDNDTNAGEDKTISSEPQATAGANATADMDAAPSPNTAADTPDDTGTNKPSPNPDAAAEENTSGSGQNGGDAVDTAEPSTPTEPTATDETPTSHDLNALRETVISEGGLPSGVWFRQTLENLPEKVRQQIKLIHGNKITELSDAAVLTPEQAALAFEIFGYPLDRAHVKGLIDDLSKLSRDTNNPNRERDTHMRDQIRALYKTTMTRLGIDETSPQNFSNEQFIHDWYTAMESGVDTLSIDDIARFQKASTADLMIWEDRKLNALLMLATLASKISEKVNQMSAQSQQGRPG